MPMFLNPLLVDRWTGLDDLSFYDTMCNEIDVLHARSRPYED